MRIPTRLLTGLLGGLHPSWASGVTEREKALAGGMDDP
jgi:hypothetical protein